MGTPVAGPGGFSKRTDKAVGEANRSLPNADYGEQAAYKDQQAGAPMAQGGQDVTGMNFNDLFGNPSSQVTGLNEDTAMPDVPVTDGADAGAGAGSEVLSSSASQGASSYAATYLPVLEFMASRPGSSDAARNLVRKLKSQL
jgi:hypothetical protein